MNKTMIEEITEDLLELVRYMEIDKVMLSPTKIKHQCEEIKNIYSRITYLEHLPTSEQLAERIMNLVWQAIDNKTSNADLKQSIIKILEEA